MIGGQNTGAAPDVEAVDAEFWALVLRDEEWLAAEFTAIVSEPCETRVRTSDVPGRIAGARPEGSATPLPTSDGRIGWPAGSLPGRQWRRERSPPLGAVQ